MNFGQVFGHVIRHKRKSGGKLLVSKSFYGRYKLPGDSDWSELNLETNDRTIADERLRAFLREKNDEHAGIVMPKPLRDAAQKRLADHLTDFAADLRVKGRDKEYVRIIIGNITRLIEECGWMYTRNVTPDSFTSWRAKQTKSPKTLNEYLNAANALLNWMSHHGRLIANPLKSVSKVDTRGRAVRLRRALTDDEVRRLLRVAGSRKLAYMLAILTGLRRGELKALQRGDVRLNAPKPFLCVRASTTKNGKRADILLRDDLVTELRQEFARTPGKETDRVLAVPSMEQLLADLKAAEIPEFDEHKRRADFHALRHTFITNLSRAGVAPRTAQKLARHSDINLTMNVYTDPAMLDTADALDRLPRFDDGEPVRMQATGTDDTHYDTHGGDKSSQAESVGVTLGGSDDSENHSEIPDESHCLSHEVTSGQAVGGMRRVGLEPTQNPASQHQEPHPTHTTTHTDPELRQVIAAWPSLSAPLRAAILTLAKAGGQ